MASLNIWLRIVARICNDIRRLSNKPCQAGTIGRLPYVVEWIGKKATQDTLLAKHRAGNDGKISGRSEAVDRNPTDGQCQLIEPLIRLTSRCRYSTAGVDMRMSIIVSPQP